MHGSSVTRLLVVNTQTRESERDWRTALHEALASDSASMFERLDIEALSAIEANDHRFVMAVSAHVLAFMLIDWGRFTKWQTWIERFERGSAASPKAENATDVEFELARVTGQLACALVRSEPIEALTELGHAAPPLLRCACSWGATTVAANVAQHHRRTGVACGNDPSVAALGHERWCD